MAAPWLEGVGTTAALIGVFITVPQVVRLARSRSADGVSLTSNVLGTLCTATWLLYGVLLADRPQLIANGPALVGSLLIVGFVVHRTGADLRTALWGALAWIAVVAAVWAEGGTSAVGTAAAALGFVTRLPQVHQAWAAPSLAGLSPTSLVLSLASAVLWAGYGIGLHLGPVVVSSLTAIALTAAVLLPLLVRVPAARVTDPGTHDRALAAA